MLAATELLDIDYIPLIEDISLNLLVDFYEQYLCKYIFVFTLQNGEMVKLFFRDPSEIFHISGIDHVYNGIPMDGSRFIREIRKGNIDINSVRMVNPNAYKDYELRIRSMACLDTIIKKCEYLYYPCGKIPESDIKVKYLLLKGLDAKNLHLGIDTYRVGRPYFSRTLLITEGNADRKFIDKADQRLRVIKLEIRNKDTDEVTVCVERQKAEILAGKEVEKIAEEWLSKEFPIILSKAFSEFENLNDIKQLPDLEFTEYKQYIKREHRQNWKRKLRGVIEEQKSILRQRVELLDPYCAGKIVAETIREYDKNLSANAILEAIDTFAHKN